MPLKSEGFWVATNWALAKELLIQPLERKINVSERSLGSRLEDLADIRQRSVSYRSNEEDANKMSYTLYEARE